MTPTLGGKRTLADPSSLEALARHLGLAGPGQRDGKLQVVAGEVWGDEVRISLEGPCLPRLLFQVDPLVAGTDSFLAGPETQVSYRSEGQAVTPALETVLRAVALRLLRTPLPVLRTLLVPAALPTRPRESVQGAPAAAPDEPAPRLQYAALHLSEVEVPWHRFLAGDRHERDLYSTLRPAVSVTHVVHADAECLNESPLTQLVRRPFVVHPSERHGASTPAGAEGSPRRVALTSNLGDLQVIAGTLPSLQAVLEHMGPRVDTQMVIVSNSCVPNVIGDDIGLAVERFSRVCPHAVVVTDRKDSPHDERLVDFLEQVVIRNGPPDPRVPGSVALLGLSNARGLSEATALLTAAGVPVSACLVPEVSAELLRRAATAEVVVRPPREVWGPTCERLAGRLPGRVVEITPPYGVAASRAWLLGIAEAVGRREPAAQAWSQAWGSWSTAWETLVREARGHRLGLVVDAGVARPLLVDGALAGLPLLDVLLEAGFGVDVVVAPAAVVPQDLARAARDRQEAGADLRLVPVVDLAGLDRTWRTAGPSAVLSEFFFDDRLSDRGLGRFSLADLEPGLQGALRTTERLLAACRLPFWKRYRTHLDRSHGHA